MKDSQSKAKITVQVIFRTPHTGETEQLTSPDTQTKISCVTPFIAFECPNARQSERMLKTSQLQNNCFSLNQLAQLVCFLTNYKFFEHP